MVAAGSAGVLVDDGDEVTGLDDVADRDVDLGRAVFGRAPDFHLHGLQNQGSLAPSVTTGTTGHDQTGDILSARIIHVPIGTTTGCPEPLAGVDTGSNSCAGRNEDQLGTRPGKSPRWRRKRGAEEARANTATTAASQPRL